MRKITIEGTPVALSSRSRESNRFPVSVSGHLLLIYEDDSGKEFVVRGGPSSSSDKGFGALTLEINRPIGKSLDARVDEKGRPVTPASRGSTIIPLETRNAEDVWNIILQHARNIDKQAFPYKPTNFNSNGTVANLLDVVGVNVNTVLPDPKGVMVLPFSGKNKKFEFDYEIIGTDSDDIIVGRGGNQTFTGGKGNDQLSGGNGDDTAVFNGQCSEYDFKRNGNGSWTITHSRPKTSVSDGIDTLTEFEFAKFSNGKFELKEGKLPCIGGDIAFVIDTTGSMADDIDAVKSSASSIINAIFDRTASSQNSRIGIIGYKDPGQTTTILGFTNQEDSQARKAAALNAINSISVNGGGDLPEGVYSGLLAALQGGMGKWQEIAPVRRIILFGDAPPKDNELASRVNELARNLDVEAPLIPTALSRTSALSKDTFRTQLTVASNATSRASFDVEIFTVVVGSNPEAQTSFQQIANQNSGRYFTATDADEVVASLLEAINTKSFRTASAPSPINFQNGKRGIRRVGANGADKLVGTTNNDQLKALKGKDLLVGKAGDDRLEGGAGRDTIRGDKGRDLLDGGLGNDSLIGASGDDVLVGGVGFDTLQGGNGADVFTLNSLDEVGDVIVDFSSTNDLIDIRKIVASPSFSDIASLAGFNALINFSQVGKDTEVRLDRDGSGPGNTSTKIVTLRNTLAANVSESNFVVN